MYLQHLSVPNALAEAEAELGHIDVVQEYIRFVRESKRGINGCVEGTVGRLDQAA